MFGSIPAGPRERFEHRHQFMRWNTLYQLLDGHLAAVADAAATLLTMPNRSTTG
jgi:hypothetical protein